MSKESDKMREFCDKNLFKQTFRLKETECKVTTDKAEAIRKALSTVIHHRTQLEMYIEKHPTFLYSLTPIAVENGPRVVRLMASASKKAGVGPMASVAGVLADLAVEAMVSLGAKVAVVENGGEIAAVSDRPINMALFNGNSSVCKIGFRLEKFPVGVATSSGVFGHALSLGEADAVTVFSENAGIADAAATAICNVVKGDDENYAIKRGIDKALSIKEVKGVLIVYKGKIGVAGKVPRLIEITNGGDKTLQTEC